MALPSGVLDYRSFIPGAQQQATPITRDFEAERLGVQGQMQQMLLGKQQKFQGPQNAADRANQIQRDQINADSGIRQQQIGADANKYGSDLSFRATSEGNQLGAQTAQRGQDISAETTRQGNHLGAQTAQRGQDLSLQASLAPVNAQMERFNSVFPQLQKAIMGTQAGYEPVTAPTYAIGPTQQQWTQSSMNDARARNAATAAGNKRSIEQSAGSRGMGGMSALLQSLTGQQDAARLIADSNDTREIGRTDSTQAAENMARSQALNAQAWAQAQQQNTSRQGNKTNELTALLAALSGMV